jgi:hypothetical protein
VKNQEIVKTQRIKEPWLAHVRHQTAAFPEETTALKRGHHSPDFQNAEPGNGYLRTRKI